MAQQPTLAVRGEAVLEVDPEIARIEVSVAAVDRDRAKTLKLLNERAVAIDKVLAGFPDAIEKTETSGIRVSPQLTGRGARDQAPRYHGAVYQTVTVCGFDRLGELMAQLADQERTEIGGPWWDLRPGSPFYAQVRVAAVKDAVRRARDYAAALGSDLTGLIELADVRLLSDSRGQGEMLDGPFRGAVAAPGARDRARGVQHGPDPGQAGGAGDGGGQVHDRQPDLAAVDVEPPGRRRPRAEVRARWCRPARSGPRAGPRPRATRGRPWRPRRSPGPRSR